MTFPVYSKGKRMTTKKKPDYLDFRNSYEILCGIKDGSITGQWISVKDHNKALKAQKREDKQDFVEWLKNRKGQTIWQTDIDEFLSGGEGK